MKKNLVSNWALLAVAFLISVMLWLFVVKYDNQMVDISLGKLQVEIINEDYLEKQGLAYWVTRNGSVSVTVNVAQTQGWKISPSDIRLTADLSNWKEGMDYIPVDAQVVNNQALIGSRYRLESNRIMISTEKLTTQQYELSLETEGEPADGYVAGDLSAVPMSVTVQAPESEMKRIVRAVAKVSVDGQKEDVVKDVPILLYDGNDDLIDQDSMQVSLSEDEVEMTAGIRVVKEVPLKVDGFTGEPAKGYGCSQVAADVETVKVAGSSQTMEKLEEIVLDSSVVDVTGAKEDVEADCHLADFLPEGVYLAPDTPETVVVKASVTVLEKREFRIAADKIEVRSLASGLKAEISPAIVKISIRGLTQQLDKLRVDELKPWVDLGGLSAGEHKVRLQLKLDSQFRQEETAVVSVTISG